MISRLHVTFIDKEGEEHTFEVAKGDNLLDIALEHDIEMEGNTAPEMWPWCIISTNWIQAPAGVHAHARHVML